MIIKIEIKNKIARAVDKRCFIVCGNDDYEIEFAFDEEWAEFEEKTAYFIANGVTLPPVVFQGNKCPVPKLSNTTALYVGVSAGDLKTTTDAVISCRKSIRCKSGAPEAPTPVVYDQIMQLINDGKVKGEQGEKGEKGDKGDAGSIKFIPVAELPTENIDEAAIYLLPVENADGENRFTEYVYIDGKWEVIGAITVQVDHSEYVKFTDYPTAGKAGVVRTAAWAGTQMQGDVIAVLPASQTEIQNQSGNYKVLVPSRISEIVKVGITENKETLTDEERTKACNWLFAYKMIKGSSGNVYVPATIGGSNNETHYRLSAEYVNGLGAQTIPLRDSEGGLRVQENPTLPLHAVPKKWVEGLIAELRAEIAALKGS